MMSEQGGYLQEQDLMQEIRVEGREVYADEPWLSVGDIYAIAAINVLRRRQLLNDLGIEQIRKAGIK